MIQTLFKNDIYNKYNANPGFNVRPKDHLEFHEAIADEPETKSKRDDVDKIPVHVVERPAGTNDVCPLSGLPIISVQEF